MPECGGRRLLGTAIITKKNKNKEQREIHA